MSRLIAILKGLPRIAIAFSGGLDSRFLCAMAQKGGIDAVACHFTGPHIPRVETQGARDFARALRLSYIEIPMDPLRIPEVTFTSRSRCYHCKKALMRGLKSRLAQMHEGDRTVCDGSNADDLAKYRPGLKALAEENVLSPLAMAGLTKAAITEQASALGIPLPREKARPCLLTRYDYGLPVRAEELARVEQAEADLLALRDEEGRALFGDFRLRLTPEPLLQVTDWQEQWRGMVEAVLRRQGFASFAVLRTESVSGYYDRPRSNG